MNLRDARVLVTGGAGFIPSHIVDLLVRRGSRVTVVDNLRDGRLENLAESLPRITFVDADIKDAACAALVAESDVVFHMAANADVPASVRDPDLDFQTNVVGSYELIRAALGSGVKKFVFASSAAVYGEPRYVPIDESHPTVPRSPYGASKLAIERLGIAYFHTFAFPFTAIRIFNTYGARQPRYVMYDLLRKLNATPDRLEVLGTGDQVRDYVYVSDAAECFVAAAEAGSRTDGEVYNLAGGDPTSIRELVSRILEVLELTSTTVTYTGSSWPGDISSLVADVSKARAELGLESRVSLNDGILQLAAWLDRDPVAAS